VDDPRPAAPDRHADTPLPAERLTLSEGRWLALREPTLADIEGLYELYHQLPVDDLYHRFFSVFRPERPMLREWIERTPSLGRRLIAERETGAIVADGGYVRMDNGDAELDLVVTRQARGWLGGYLLDRLVQAARSDGIANLRADVLVDNGSMLALIHHRRYAATGHDDHTIAHLCIAASAETPTWPPTHDRPRILIEGGGLGWIPDGLRSALGVDVMQCPGPGGPGSPCPALEGRSCPLAAGADAVVCALGPDERGAILAAHRRRDPGARLFVTNAGGTADIDADVLPEDRPALESVACALGLPIGLPTRFGHGRSGH
jgi:hypothetical protein